ncbi:hypothetical protein TIFTF001_011213 [Ficus carica]|uniref:Uncharacterized protein n=1 Tax=Ficus carica TaxID=3494 RepID=A0AA88AL89_FICCA|nr:hypothetical protein TIFTF001_011213 [Ficus carica]
MERSEKKKKKTKKKKKHTTDHTNERRLTDLIRTLQFCPCDYWQVTSDYKILYEENKKNKNKETRISSEYKGSRADHRWDLGCWPWQHFPDHNQAPFGVVGMYCPCHVVSYQLTTPLPPDRTDIVLATCANTCICTCVPPSPDWKGMWNYWRSNIRKPEACLSAGITRNTTHQGHPDMRETPINIGVHHLLIHPTGVSLTPRCFSIAGDQAENDYARLTTSSDLIGCCV